MEKKKRNKVIIFILAFVVLAALVAINLMKGKGGKIKVQTDQVARGEITEMVSGSARIQPEVQVKISAKVSGQIIRLGVEEGDAVEKGQFLVQLDREYYQAVVEQAASSLNYAKAGFEKAKNEYLRSEKLFKNSLLSEAELEISKSAFKQAEAQVEQAEANLRQAKDNLDKTTIVSPMDGIVSKLNKKVGEMAMGSELTLDEIMVVSDLSRMLAETEIDENDVVEVSVGDTSYIDVDAFQDTTFLGVVKEIANTGTTRGLGTQDEITNFLVKVSMIQVPDRIRPGMSATVDIITEKKNNVLKVPIQCVTVREPVRKDDQNEGEEKEDSKVKDDASAKQAAASQNAEPVKVLFVVKENVAHQVEIQTGIASDTEWEIEGVEENDEVVSGSYRILTKQLKDGDVVTIDNSLKKFDKSEN